MPRMQFQRGFRYRGGMRPVINSIKNVISSALAGATATTINLDLAKAVNTPVNTVTTDVSQGCLIKAIYIAFTCSAIAEVAVGTSNFVEMYLFKNVGANLTRPTPGSIGSSNEKRFVIKMWKGIIRAPTQGFPSFTFRGWIKIPKKYQRMATDDVWQFVTRSEGVGHLNCLLAIYKWYR